MYVCVNVPLLPADVLVQKVQKVFLPQHTGFKVLLPGDVIHRELHTSDEPLQWQHLHLKEKDSGMEQNNNEIGAQQLEWKQRIGIELEQNWNDGMESEYWSIGMELEWNYW